MKRWYVGSVDYPDHPLVEVTYERPWRYFKLRPVVTVLPLSSADRCVRVEGRPLSVRMSKWAR